MRLLSLDDHAAKKLAKIRKELAANALARQQLQAARRPDREIQADIAEGLNDLIRESPAVLGPLAFADNRSGRTAVAEALRNERYVAQLLRRIAEKAIGKDALEQIMTEDAVDAAGGPESLSAIDRQAALDKLEVERRKLATDEEVETLALEAAGHTVARRSDVDAALVLEVWNAELQDDEAAA